MNNENITYTQIAYHEDERFRVTVLKPDLTPEEYERRHKMLEKACRDILIEQLDAHAKAENNKGVESHAV